MGSLVNWLIMQTSLYEYSDTTVVHTRCGHTWIQRLDRWGRTAWQTRSP